MSGNMAMSGEVVEEKDVLDPKDLEQLYTWIDAVPLSRQKKNIARDFSDGVFVAEIVRFYLPRLVEIHNYVSANSQGQKKINWGMLQRKIFVKLNLKLADKLIDNVIEAKPGAIEQVLWDLRKKILEHNPKAAAVKAVPLTNEPSPMIDRPPPVSSVNSNPLLNDNPVKQAGLAAAQAPSSSHQSRSHRSTPTSRLPSPSPVSARKAGKGADGVSYAAGLKDELHRYGKNVATSSPASLRTAGQVAAADGSSGGAGPSSSSGATTGFFPGVIDVNSNGGDPAALPPAHLIYKGHKMVPAILLDVKSKQIRDLETIISSLQKKVSFLDNLVQLKDSRVEDLTRQVHNMKSKFQELTHTNMPEL